MKRISGLKVMITGGSSGIGKSIAKLLADQGAIVVITGRDKNKLERVAQEIRAIPIHLDVTKYNQIAVKTLDAFHTMGGIDVLINNAGIGEFSKLEDLKIEQFQRIFSTNVFGLSMLTQEVVKFFRTQQKGTIINIGSTAAKKGFAGGSIYAASKFAVRGLSQCWKDELRRDNIRVMLINPSEVPTAFNQEGRKERSEENKKLTSYEIAHAVVSVLAMDDRGMVPEMDIWATNPF